MNTEFKRKYHTCGRYGHTQNECPTKNKSGEEKGKRSLQANAITVVRWGINPQIAGNNKEKRPKNWKKKEIKGSRSFKH